MEKAHGKIKLWVPREVVFRSVQRSLVYKCFSDKFPTQVMWALMDQIDLVPVFGSCCTPVLSKTRDVEDTEYRRLECSHGLANNHAMCGYSRRVGRQL